MKDDRLEIEDLFEERRKLARLPQIRVVFGIEEGLLVPLGVVSCSGSHHQ